MSKELKKDDVIKHKKNAIKSLNHVFEAFINNPDSKTYLKKTDILSYWIEDYSNYLLQEKSFDYTKVLNFKRGDVVKINLGFNVGSEQGGLHFGIVLDNDNKKSSKVVTILPLSSGTEEETYERDVYLGNELYLKMLSKYNDLESSIKQEIQSIKNKIDTHLTSEVDDDLIDELNERVKNLNAESNKLIKFRKEIDKLKIGSIALTEQITTISKMRIYTPKSRNDLLYGIKFSEDTMDKINEKIKKLFIFE